MRVLLCFVVTMMMYNFVNSHSYESCSLQMSLETDCNCSVFGMPYKNVLSRNKRWFVFPKGGNLLITMVNTKTIIGWQPRGLQESMELELAYGLPPWVEGWKPISLLNHYNAAKNNPSTNSPISNKTIMSAQRRMNSAWVKNYNNRYTDKYNQQSQWPKPVFRTKTRNFGTNSIHQKFLKNPDTSKLPSSYFRQNHMKHRNKRHESELEDFFEKYFGINIESCIRRIICEVQGGLLPQGQSFIQDVVRIILKNTMDEQFLNDSSQIPENKQTNCATKFPDSCPFGVVEHFFQSKTSQAR